MPMVSFLLPFHFLLAVAHQLTDDPSSLAGTLRTMRQVVSVERIGALRFPAIRHRHFRDWILL